MALFKKNKHEQLLEYQNVNPNPTVDKKQQAKTKKNQIITVICTTLIALMAIAGMIVAIVFCL